MTSRGLTRTVRFVYLCFYKTLYGRTFDLRVKSKYVGLNSRNKDHLPQLSPVCVCNSLGAIGGDLGKLWVSGVSELTLSFSLLLPPHFPYQFSPSNTPRITLKMHTTHKCKVN